MKKGIVSVVLALTFALSTVAVAATVKCTVDSVEGDKVTMDFNHPMAGQDLYFTGKIAEIREATKEELAHGHVHNGDHHH